MNKNTDQPNADPIVLDSDDVTVEPLEPPRCEECYDEPATHGVWFDLRGNGVKHRVAEGCAECMTAFAEGLRASLARPTLGPITDLGTLTPNWPRVLHDEFHHTARCNAGGCHD